MTSDGLGCGISPAIAARKTKARETGPLLIHLCDGYVVASLASKRIILPATCAVENNAVLISPSAWELPATCTVACLSKAPLDYLRRPRSST